MHLHSVYRGLHINNNNNNNRSLGLDYIHGYWLKHFHSMYTLCIAEILFLSTGTLGWRDNFNYKECRKRKCFKQLSSQFGSHFPVFTVT